MPPEGKGDAGPLWDMLEAARAAREFLSDKTLLEYQSDPLLQSAIERKIEIIGEN